MHADLRLQASVNGSHWECVHQDGKVLWERPFRVSASVPIVTRSKKLILVPTTPNDLECVTANGSTHWKMHFDDLGDPTAIAVTERYVILGVGATSPVPKAEVDNYYKVRCISLSDGRLLWEKGHSKIGRPLLGRNDDSFFSLGHGVITLRNGAAGNILKQWRFLWNGKVSDGTPLKEACMKWSYSSSHGIETLTGARYLDSRMLDQDRKKWFVKLEGKIARLYIK